MQYRRYRTLGMLLATLALLPACRRGETSAEKQAADSLSVVSITTAQAQTKEYTTALQFTGTAEAIRSANLGTALPGRVERIHCQRGEAVRKGELLVEMSDEMLVQAQIERDALKQDLGRVQRLNQKGTISTMDLEHLQAKYEASEAKVSMLKSNTSIVAPFSGVVTKILVHEGENYSFVPTVTSEFKLEGGILQLRQLDPLKVVVAVNEQDVPKMKVGTAATVRFDTFPLDTVRGKIIYVAPELSRRDRSCEVEVEIPNRKEVFKPGMFCNVTLTASPRQGVFVPLRALLKMQGTGDEYVFTIDENDIAHRTPVTRKESMGGWVMVEGVEPNAVVAIEGKSKLNDGCSVAVVRSETNGVAKASQGGAR